MASNRKRIPNQYRIDNDQGQDQDDDQYRSRFNSSGFIHNYLSHNVQSTICNNGGAVRAESSNDHQFVSTGANRNQVQEQSPIHLKLNISDQSLIRRIEFALRQKKKQKYDHQEQGLQSTRSKLKACNLFALFLRIGSWNWESKHLGDLVVKFYYKKRKVVWEFLFGPMKRKMETDWTKISAINATVDEDKKCRLEIELRDPPEFFKESTFRPIKHTQWEKTDDFTQGQAQRCRRHTILFSPGVLEEPFKKLLQCDNRLYNLNRQPFPVHNSPFFDIPSFDFQYNNGVTGSSLVPQSNHLQNLVHPINSFAAHSRSNVPMPGVEQRFDFSFNNGVTGSSLVPQSNHLQNLVHPINSFAAHSRSNVTMPGVEQRFDFSYNNGVTGSSLVPQSNHLQNLVQPINSFAAHSRSMPGVEQRFDFSYNNGVTGSSLVPQSNHLRNLVQPINSFAAHSRSNVPMPGVLMVPNSYEIAREFSYVNEITNCVLEQSGNNQIQDTPLPPIREKVDDDLFEGLEPIIPDEQMELRHVDYHNLAKVATEQYCLKVNRQNNFNPFVARTYGSSSTSGGVNVTNRMVYIDEDEDVCCSTQPLFDDNAIAFQEPCYLSSSQYSMHGYHINGGNGGSSTSRNGQEQHVLPPAMEDYNSISLNRRCYQGTN